jgi:hypothetical protein
MAYATRWEQQYDEEIIEATAAAALVALEPSPRIWPISGPDADEFNPDGYPINKAMPADPLVAPPLNDERTGELHQRKPLI